MAEQKQTTATATANTQQMNASKIDALYSWLSYDLQKLKKELLNEMKYSSVQIGSLYDGVKGDTEKSSKAITQEIRYSYIQNQNIYDGLSNMLSETVARIDDVIARLDSFASEELAEGIKEKVASVLPPIEDTLNEIKYSYLQHQSIYESLKTQIDDGVVAKMDEMNARFSLIDQMDEALEEMRQKIAELTELTADNKNLVDQIVAAVPVAENVDYVRISDEVGDKMLEVLGDVLVQQPVAEPVAPAAVENTPVEANIDYDRIIYGTTEKVVESLPYPDKVDYRRIEDMFAAAVSSVVAKALSDLDIDALATKVAEKLQAPAATCEIDYEKLSDMVAAKVAANAAPVAAVETVDYERISAIIDEKLANDSTEEETTFDFVIDDEGIDAIATSVSAKLCEMCAACEETVEEAPEEAVTAEVVETPVEEVAVVEEAAEETMEEVVEKTVVEEPTTEEIAVTKEPEYEEVGGELIDAETGMVVRLKRSFTAKMSQSEEDVKSFYSDLKNALLSYKKVRSNVSWHGDRFNYGRETIAKMGINGKTLCFYVALDPNDEEQFKPTVYHQKNVGDQRAHESTPFMVKVRSAAAVKKAVRLVDALAQKVEAEKMEDAQTVQYAEEFPFMSTKDLLNDGHIKLTKEKKVEFNF